MMTNRKILMLAALALMLGAGLWLTGCESDTVAPHDATPALNDEDVAYQSAAMAAAAARVLPELVDFSGVSKNEYSYDFSGQPAVTGTVYFDFRMGGADGAPAVYSVATWGRMFTDGESIDFEVGIGGIVALEFDVMADIDPATDTATLLAGSQGTFVAGDYNATFSFADVVVTAGDNYPSGGTMTFNSAGREMIVTFDGNNMVTITFEGSGTWEVDLDDGSVTEIV